MKKILNKYTVTAFIIAAVIILTCVFTFIDYKKENIIEKPQSVSGIFTGTKKLTEAMFNDNLLGFEQYIGLYSATQKLLGCRIFDDEGYGMVIKDSDGKLHFPTERTEPSDMERYVSSIEAFFDELSELDVPFLYVQLTGKMLKDVTELPAGAYSYANENADEFLAALDEREIPYYDMRGDIINSVDDHTRLFYDTDHHWTTETAFFAFGKLVSLLNERFGFGLDPENYFCDIGNWKKTLYEDSFLGSQGKRIGRPAAGIDDYTLIEPNFATDYLLYDASALYEEPLLMRSGSFRESLIYEEALESSDITANKHAAYFQYDYGDMIIRNTSVQNDLRLLIIKDSFSLPLIAYLSTCVSEIHMIDLRDSGAPILKEYVKQNDFDAVLVIYNTGVFVDSLFTFDSDF